MLEAVLKGLPLKPEPSINSRLRALNLGSRGHHLEAKEIIAPIYTIYNIVVSIFFSIIPI